MIPTNKEFFSAEVNAVDETNVLKLSHLTFTSILKIGKRTDTAKNIIIKILTLLNFFIINQFLYIFLLKKLFQLND